MLNCKLLVCTNWNVSRLSTVAGWWNHVGSRDECVLKRRTSCRYMIVSYIVLQYTLMSLQSHSQTSILQHFNDPCWDWFGAETSLMLCVSVCQGPILFPWWLSIMCFQVDMGAVPATLVNFVSKRQPLAIAYLRDYLISTSLHISSKENSPS